MIQMVPLPHPEVSISESLLFGVPTLCQGVKLSMGVPYVVNLLAGTSSTPTMAV